MKKNLLQRFIIIAIVTLGSLYIVFGPRRAPKLSDFTLAGINNTLRENIRLGLDLRGGSQLVMRVKVADYLKRLTENNALAVQNAARDAGYAVKEVRPEVSGSDYRIVLEANDAAKINEIRDELPKKVDLSAWTANVNGNRITWELTTAAQRTLSEQAVDQAYRIIDSRINAFGVVEPTLQKHGAQGSNQILLQMPGIDDPERIKKLLVGESRLELVHIVSPPSPAPAQRYPTQEAAIQSLGGTVPSNRRVLPYSERDEPTSAVGQTDAQDKPKQWVVVESPPVVDGSELRSADATSPTGGQGNDFQISFALKPSGADKFGRWTGSNINQYMG
ncbi:MAG: hypothetical protein M3R15_16695, partial [Acidobacteriota bacterium]|nr:hypothetical protein [Acidobacteriota bacterium]